MKKEVSAKKPKSPALPSFEVLQKICARAQYLATQMIYLANHRDDKEKGDPKIGGHPAASSSSVHILGALHLVAKTGFDFFANKPHASPSDHSFNYLLDLFLNKDGNRLTVEEKNQAMHGLRAFPHNDEYVFQSYHSAYDSDHHGFLPSGTVGIPPVNVGYLALAYRFAQEHGYDVPDAHFWALIGDSEFREGSLFEAIPDFAERELGNVTWIIDYNRQSLDGHRISNQEIMGGNDAHRIEGTMRANGWDVIQVRHGQKREALFKKKGGEAFRKFLEEELLDYELQALLLVKDVKQLKTQLQKDAPQLKQFLTDVKDQELYEGVRDLGGHDLKTILDAMMKSKEDTRRPTMIIAHTLKGWGLASAAAQGNHSSLPDQEEVDLLREGQGLKAENLFAGFDPSTPEGQFLKQRGEELYGQIQEMKAIKARNLEKFDKDFKQFGEMPATLGINTKMASYPHTQWMLGQLTAKMTRVANTSLDETKLKDKQKPLSNEERTFKLPAEMLLSMAPDVGTSTNLNPAMDGKIFGAPTVEDYETELDVKDTKLPDLVPGQEVSDRFLRFDIAEANVMSCVGSFGKMKEFIGVPLLPLMTVYDFFIKRAHDQYFYNLYWNSSFILVGTPAGVTLSPEGAQHGWKSDFQIPNQITWEPFFCAELDWIFCESIRRHHTGDNQGRSGVLIRGVTRGIEQRDFIKNLKKQLRFKSGLSEGQLIHPQGFPLGGATDESQVETLGEEQIFETIRLEVLQGAYYLVDYRGYANYEPGDNVVHIFSMGAPTTEAIKASELLLEKGIYANVIVITSSDLVVGIQAHQNGYEYLKQSLGVNGDLYLHPVVNGSALPGEIVTLSGRRVPIVSVHDGEAGLLDNIGSVIGVKQESLAVRKHSKCGRPADVYRYHHLDSQSVVEAAEKVLSETALENVKISMRTLQTAAQTEHSFLDAQH